MEKNLGPVRSPIILRPVLASDHVALKAILGSITRDGLWWPIPPDSSDDDALAFWLAVGDVFIAERDRQIVGSYYIRANLTGGGSHVANGGFAVARSSWKGGVGRALCVHALAEAERRGYKAMQFNSVLSSNTRAIALYKGMGFVVVGRVPEAFLHPTQGYVDLLIMHRFLGIPPLGRFGFSATAEGHLEESSGHT